MGLMPLFMDASLLMRVDQWSCFSVIMFRRFELLLLITCVLTWSLVLSSGAGFAQEPENAETLRQEIDVQRSRLESLEQNIKKNKSRIIKVEKGKIEVLSELQELDRKIEEAWDRLDAVKKQWSAAELELEIIRQELEKIQCKADALKEYTEERLIALREMGMVGALNILFKAESLPDFMAREQYLKLIIRHDREKRQEYLEIISKLEKKKPVLEQKNREFARLSRDVEEQARLLEQRKEEREVFLQELEKKGRKYAEMLKELKKAKKSLQAVIDDLNNDLKFYTGPTEQELGSFAAQKGKLNPPVMGPAYPVYDKGSASRVRGITIAVPFGSEIRAIFDGKVIYNMPLKGFGQVIIIDHGDGYMSLTAQGTKFFKKVGEEVVEGDVIGISGGGPWRTEGIYFELRHGKKQENPLDWFDPRVIVMGR